MSHNSINVMLVEDSPEYREVIKPALDDEPDMELSSPLVLPKGPWAV